MASEDKDPSWSLYERDFYAWARREAVLLQRREFAQLDLDNVIEELDSLGRQERARWEDHITWAIELLENISLSIHWPKIATMVKYTSITVLTTIDTVIRVRQRSCFLVSSMSV